MARTLVVLLFATLLLPLAAALPTNDAAAPSLSDRLVPVADALAGARDATASGAASAASAIGAGFSAIGGALANAATAIGGALASAASTIATAAATVGALLASLAIGAFETARDHPRETAIAATSAASAGGLLFLLKRYGALLLAPLYTRLAPSQMLDNEARNRVYEHVRANPGAHPSAIAETLDLGWGTVIYHLTRLEQSKHVVAKSAHHKKCYFVVGGSLDAHGREAIAAMANDKAKLIVTTVRDAPGISQKELATRTGMSQALASWHVKRLVTSGVLLTARDGRSNQLRVAEHVPLAMPVAATA